MPAPNQVTPESLASRIRLWLLDNPGSHRPRDIATGLGASAGYGTDRSRAVIAVGRRVSQMAATGKLVRTQGQYGSEYALPASEPATTDA